ncbi:patatin-like protein 2 [Dorcoceras hygrometricum]|uniref:Patatin-like protein 2 n=1 Tax=Dorcoceras hygrometricum TaxID=472368 RepID=A0A2Z7DKR2_9LAMI|nr:patatin-like protein 2 [Dorcoceras hygrometricum]
MVVSTIGGTTVEIYEEIFAVESELPMEGLTDLSEVPKDLVFDAQSRFFESKEQVGISCLKREMKIEYRLLSDILAKTIYVKAGSFDAVTRKRFLLMTAITFDVKVNWSRLLFDILKDMVTPGSRKAKGYAIQMCVLLKNVPGLDLGDSKAFPSPRILTEKTVHRYVVISEKVGAEEVTDEPRVKKAPKTKVASKKRPADVVATKPIVKKKRATKRKPVNESVDEQVAESTTDEETVVENIVEKIDEPVSLPTEADVVNEGISATDDVDVIIEQILAETAKIGTDEDDQDAGTSDVGDKTAKTDDREKHWFDLSYEEIIAQMTERPVVTPCDTDEEMGTTVGTNVGVQTESFQYDYFVEEPLREQSR